MDHPHNLTSCNAVVGGPIGLSYPDDTTEPQLYYQGMSVQTVNPPFSVYFDNSIEDQNNAYSINPLNEFRVAPAPQAVPMGMYELDFPVIPKSILDECVPYNADNESIDDTLLSTPSSYPHNLSYFLEDEPDIREPIPVNLSNPDHHLTHLPAELSNPQDSPPFAEVNQLNLQKATSDNPTNSAEIVDDKSSQVERQRERVRERRKDLAYAERERERRRELTREHRKDPAYAERERERKREYQKKRRKDPAYAEREREHQKERRKDPAYAERIREWQREWQRERHKDPVYAEYKREYKKEYQRRRYQNDPVYTECRREQERKRQRELYQNDPTYSERQRERKRKRYRNDPTHAEGQRIYLNTYNRIKRKTSNKEEASKQASIAREQYFQSVNLPGNSDELLQTSNQVEAAQDFSKNVDDAPPPLVNRQAAVILQSQSTLSHPETRSAIEGEDGISRCPLDRQREKLLSVNEHPA